MRVGGPNAGHTVVDSEGQAYPLRTIPVAAAVDDHCALVIAAGSELDLGVLEGEIRLLEADGHAVCHRLFIDPEATVIEELHHELEGDMPHGSTQKGIGAARASRLMRTAKRAEDFAGATIGDHGLTLGTFLADTAGMLRRNPVAKILIEGTQGYGLGSHAGYYPYCTSGDCRAQDFMAQAGLPPQDAEVWVVLRTYPIRIAGDSGPLRQETTWDEVGVAPEFTTVTKKMRRVGNWDAGLARRAVAANGGPRVKVALTFADYWDESLRGVTELPSGHPFLGRVHGLEQELRAPIKMLGTGPDTQIELEDF